MPFLSIDIFKYFITSTIFSDLLKSDERNLLLVLPRKLPTYMTEILMKMAQNKQTRKQTNAFSNHRKCGSVSGATGGYYLYCYIIPKKHH